MRCAMVNTDRLTIALDEKSKSIIQKFTKEGGSSKTAVVRQALECLDEHEKFKNCCSTETMKVYCDFLANKDHMILDVDHWAAFFEEIGKGSDKFWKELYEIGISHQKEYFNRDLRDIKDVLRFVEKTNWYILKEDSKDHFTLVLNLSISSKFVEIFFKGFFKNYPQDVIIKNEGRKIRIFIKK